MPDRPTTGEIEQRTATVEVERIETEGRTLRGFAALYGAESRDLGGFREVIERGAFSDVLASEPDTYLTFNHSPDRVLARTTSGTLRLADEERGLAFEADLGDGPTAQDVVSMVSRGDVSGVSFRFRVDPGGDRWEGERRTLTRIASLVDISLATSPAYSGPRVELRSQPEPPAAPEPTIQEATVPEETGGGLLVEDRAATDNQPDVETRVLNALTSVRKGESRSLTLTTADPIAPPELSTYLWDRIRPNSVAIASGIRRVTTDRSEVNWPALTGDMSAAWVAEAAVIPATDPTFSTLTAKPSKLAARAVFSNEVADDSEPSAVGVLTEHVGRIMGNKLDIAVYEGSGTAPEIRGLAGTTGIQTIATMGANGATPADLDFFADAIAALEGESIPGPYVAVMPPRTWATLRKLREQTGSLKPLLADPPSLDAPRQVLGVPVYLSAQLSTSETRGTSGNSSSVYVYSVAGSVSPVLVDRQGVDAATVEMDRSRLFDSDQSELRGKVRVDLLVPYPTAVARVVGVRA